MTYNIVALPGDGIGPEILNGSLSLLEIISNKYNFNYQIEHQPIWAPLLIHLLSLYQ